MDALSITGCLRELLTILLPLFTLALTDCMIDLSDRLNNIVMVVFYWMVQVQFILAVMLSKHFRHYQILFVK